MHEGERTLRSVRRDGVEILVAIDGEGPSLIVLPSFGRDGLKDFDQFTDRLVRHGLQVVRPQPRGIAGSQGPLQGIDLTSLAADVAAIIEAVAGGPAIVLGHAFGNFVARVLSVERPDTVRGVILAAASATVVAPDINITPFIAGDPTRPEQEWLAALRKAFFAPDHDPRSWLDGWYPTALAAQHEAVKRTILAPIGSAAERRCWRSSPGMILSSRKSAGASCATRSAIVQRQSSWRMPRMHCSLSSPSASPNSS